MSFYNHRQYKGQSIGRILHALDVYAPKIGIVDEIQVGEGEVRCTKFDFKDNKFQRKSVVFATYTWEGEDIPRFIFLRDDIVGMPNSKTWERNQYFKKPFLDNEAVLFGHFNYCVQEVQKVISLADGLFLIWKRDKIKEAEVSEDLKKKIVDSIKVSFHNRLSEKCLEDMWLHVANCAIYDVFAPNE